MERFKLGISKVQLIYENCHFPVRSVFFFFFPGWTRMLQLNMYVGHRHFVSIIKTLRKKKKRDLKNGLGEVRRMAPLHR